MTCDAIVRDSATSAVGFFRGRTAVCLVMALAMAAGAAPEMKPAAIPGVEKAAESEADRVVVAGQPTKETLDAAAKKGYKVVVNLRRPEEMAKLPFDEKAAVEAAGMKYISVPMSTSLPKEDQLTLVLDALKDSKNNPVFLHCASANRAGAIWALHCGLDKGMSADAAIADGKAAGMSNEALEHVVRNRIAAGAAK